MTYYQLGRQLTFQRHCLPSCIAIQKDGKKKKKTKPPHQPSVPSHTMQRQKPPSEAMKEPEEGTMLPSWVETALLRLSTKASPLGNTCKGCLMRMKGKVGVQNACYSAGPRGCPSKFPCSHDERDFPLPFLTFQSCEA